MAKILICSNFSGSYNRKYIGHEFINLFPSDSDGWNFYVPSYGCVKKEFGKGKEPDYLIMVEPINGFYRLIGIATGLEFASNCYSSSNKKEIQRENAAHGSISYFKKTLNYWFGSQPNTLFVSYKLKEEGHIFVPNEGIDIFVSLDINTKKNPTNDEIIIYGSWACYGDNREKLIGQSQRSYFDDNKGLNGKILSLTDQIKNLLSNGLLRDASKDKPLSVSSIKTMYHRYFTEIIGQENNENAFSDWLAEYLSNIEFYNHFAEKLGLKPTSKSLNVTREKDVGGKKRVDIYIETDDEVILIENKIHTNIHMSNIDDTTISQLDAYFNAVKKEVGASKTVKAFLLCPNYYEKYGYAGPSSLWNKSVWSPIYYSSLKDIVDKFMTKPEYLKYKCSKYFYIDEFSKSLGIHSKTKPESMRDVMLRKIAKLI